MSFKNHWLTSYQNIYSNISFPKSVNKTCPCGVTIFTSHHKVITSSRLLQTRLLHQGVSRLLRHDDVDQSQNVSKSADFRCEKMHFCSSESRESRIFGISALKTIVLKNKTKLFFDLQLVNCLCDDCDGTLSPFCVYRMYRPWVRSAVFDKSTAYAVVWVLESGAEPLRRFSGLAKRWMTLGTPGGAFGAIPTASLFFGHGMCPNGMPWTRARLQRHSGPPRLWLESFSVAAAIKATMV